MKTSEANGWRRIAMVFVAVAVLLAGVTKEIWSQNAVTREAFEVASVKPRSAPMGGPRGGSGVSASPPAVPPPCSKLLPPQTSPGRFVLYNATLYAAITLAYGKGCLVLSGGPEWTRSDKFDIEAIIPEGSPRYTTRQIREGDAPKLQMMIQTLLADRFKLALRRETKEMPAYN